MSAPASSFATPRWPEWLTSRPLDLAQALARGSDNVTLVRLVAASLVIAGHSHALVDPARAGVDPLTALFPDLALGLVAIYIFFALSGFLVTTSYLRSRSPWQFLAGRALRVLPGYYACLAVTVFGFGLASTTLAPDAYLAHPDTWFYMWRNLDLISLAWSLPGVFEHNPGSTAANGSLWSLALESRLYVYWVALAAIGVLGWRCGFTVLALAVIALAIGETFGEKPDHDHYRSLTATFVIGALAAHWARYVPVSGRVLVLAAMATMLARGTTLEAAAAVVTLVYAMFWLAWRVPSAGLFRTRDWSYGVFLYGFPVQQAVVASWPTIAPLATTAIALPIAFAFGAVSWRFVEAPMLALKSRLRSAPRTRAP